MEESYNIIIPAGNYFGFYLVILAATFGVSPLFLSTSLVHNVNRVRSAILADR